MATVTGWAHSEQNFMEKVGSNVALTLPRDEGSLCRNATVEKD
jgi:hypothetical protein